LHVPCRIDLLLYRLELDVRLIHFVNMGRGPIALGQLLRPPMDGHDTSAGGPLYVPVVVPAVGLGVTRARLTLSDAQPECTSRFP
jgi:hypothetical protein